MLRRIRICGFKTVADVTLDLGQLNVLVGANGSGKTNLLEGIALLGCASSGQVDQYSLKTRGIRMGIPGLYTSALKAQKSRSTITMEGSSGRALYRVNLKEEWPEPWEFITERMEERYQEIARRDGDVGRVIFGKKRCKEVEIWPEEHRGIRPVVCAIPGRKAIVKLMRRLDGFAIYAPYAPMLRDAAVDPSPKLPMGLHGGSLDECAYGLQQRPDLWRRALQEVSNMSGWAGQASRWSEKLARFLLRDRHLKPDVRWISAREADQGTLHVLFTFMLLLHPWTPPLLAVENIDHPLDATLVRRLAERMQGIVLSGSGERQLLWATQRTEVLEVLNLRDDRVRVLRVYRDSTGATVVKRVEHADVAGGRPQP